MVSSEGSSAGSASAVWTRTVEPTDADGLADRTLELRALFTILHEGETHYSILLRVQAEGLVGPERDPLTTPALGIRGIPPGRAILTSMPPVGVYPLQPFVMGPFTPF